MNDLYKAVKAFLSLPNWQHRGPHWADIEAALMKIQAAFKAMPAGGNTAPRWEAVAFDDEWSIRWSERMPDGVTWLWLYGEENKFQDQQSAELRAKELNKAGRLPAQRSDRP